MKCKILLTALLLFVGIGTTLLHAQRMTINLHDGSKQDIELNALQKITFSNNNLVLNFSSGLQTPVGISTIRKINLSANTSGTTNVRPDEKPMTLFFNPADGLITVEGLPDSTTPVNIYRPDGVLVLKAQISSSDNNVNASSLANGIYLLKINNQVFKFKK